MDKYNQELLDVMQALGLRDVLMDHAVALHTRAVNAERAWEGWLDTPTFVRRQVLPDHEARLDAIRREAKRDLDTFARNPFAWLPLALQITRNSSGEIVTGVFVGLELAHA